VRASTAPDLSKIDGLRPLERAARHPLMLGLFIPLQQGAWSPSTWTRGTSWTFEYNAECAVRADELGFDLVFGLAQWLGKGGYGGEMRFRENATDPLLVTAGLAPLTRNAILIATVHILYGWHPLHLAVEADQGDAVSLLIAHGAKMDARARGGMTPLHVAVQHHRAAVLSLMLARGADPNVRNEQGQTPLHLAAFHGKPDLASALLAAGARTDLKDDQGRTPLDLARLPSRSEQRNQERASVAALLEAKAAKPKASRGASATPAP
jgi:hypothetical protein